MKGGWKARLLIQEVLLNVLMLLPVGVVIPDLLTTKKIVKTVLVGFSISIAIEMLQLVLRRGLLEIDDVIHNTLGCFMGCLLNIAYHKMKLYIQCKTDNK